MSVRRRASGRVHYNYFRDYDPAVGRYVQNDPIGLRGGLNTYRYADANPISHVDPTGEMAGQLVRGAWWTGTRIGAGINWAVAGLTGGLSIGSLIYDMCNDEDDEPDCEMASPWKLKQAGITDPHQFKTDYGAVPNSRFDICACDDGSIVIKAVGQCGQSGPGIPTFERWK